MHHYADDISVYKACKKNIGKLHLESAAHVSMTGHRAAAWSHLRKECIWVYLGDVIECGSDGPMDSRHV